MGYTFTVEIPAMTGASGKLTEQAQVFEDTANKVLQQAQELKDSGWWDDSASEVFVGKMGELQQWCVKMGSFMKQYGTMLNQGAESYREKDEEVASKW